MGAVQVGLILPSVALALVPGLVVDQVDVLEAVLGVVAGHIHVKGAGHIAEGGTKVEAPDGNPVSLQGDTRKMKELVSQILSFGLLLRK